MRFFFCNIFMWEGDVEMNKFIGVFCLICCCRELEEVKFNVKEILGFFCL